MTEETHNAAMAGSIGIVMAIGVSAVLVSPVRTIISSLLPCRPNTICQSQGWFLLVGLLFSIQDYDNTVASATGQPITQIFLDTVGENGAIVLMVRRVLSV